VILDLAGPTEEEREALDSSINALRRRSPIMSASYLATKPQKIVLGLLAVLALASFVPFPSDTAAAIVSTLTLVYLVTLIDRMHLFAQGLSHHPAIQVSDEEARALTEEELPVYTVLLAVYKEHEMMAQLLSRIGALEYPSEQLDIKLLLEADDSETIAAARSAVDSCVHPVELVIVPAAQPRTKPKALNYGIQSARGEYVTIYDAEDSPDPLQLRRVVAAFRRSPPELACIQAMLKFRNDRVNTLTRWFTCEYAIWHAYVLPALMQGGSPIPLAGTSNHIRMDALRAVGGWDPFNVTEDADLGIRLARFGYSTAVIDSVTYEEANSDPINWIRQRSRWYKGYLQTFLVHTRHPIELWRQLGPGGTVRFANVTLGTSLLPIANAVFWWLIPVWVLGQPALLRSLFPPFCLYIGLFSLVVGNSAVVLSGLLVCRAEDKPHLAMAALFVPAYWVLMAIAAVKALVQLVFNPFYWEKTEHVLDESQNGD